MHRYNDAALRPDRSLLDYFFLPADDQRPLLCAIDLPGGTPWGSPPPTDAAHTPGCATGLLSASLPCAHTHLLARWL